MKIASPKYYSDFSCIAGDCPDSCCKEWTVDVDAESAENYRNLPGELGDALRQILEDTEDGTVMTIQDGRCPMWRQDGLCRIQAELGHEALCKTCRDFPRLRHDYGDFVELGLELSCPEAARLILMQPSDLVTEDTPGGEDPEYDTEAMQILLRSREVVLDYLESGKLPVNEKLAVILVYAHQVQNWLDGGEEALLREDSALELLNRHANCADWSSLISVFRELEILTPAWKQRLDSPLSDVLWHGGYLPLMRYFVARHWLQAVSDYDLVGRVKFMIAACLLIGRLGGDFIRTAQQFSKEIENDTDNLYALFDGAYTNPALSDMNLLSLLRTV